MHEDVEVQLSGTDGNVFAVIGAVSKALTRAGYRKDAEEFMFQAGKAKSYDEVIQLCMKTVEVR